MGTHLRNSRKTGRPASLEAAEFLSYRAARDTRPFALWKDFRYAIRTLLKTPGYTAVALVTLALGIGANTAIFSVVNQVLLNPSGVAHPERIVSIRARYEKLALHSIGVSIPDFTDVLHSTHEFDAAALINRADFNYTGSAIPERLRGANVTWQWFQVFGARPMLGRLFRPEEDRPNANQEVVLSYAAWTRLFGKDPGTVGRTVQLNQMSYRIIGVMGRNFAGRWMWISGRRSVYPTINSPKATASTKATTPLRG